MGRIALAEQDVCTVCCTIYWVSVSSISVRFAVGQNKNKLCFFDKKKIGGKGKIVFYV